MIQILNDDFFILSNQQIMQVLYRMPSGHLGCCYFGAPIKHLTPSDLHYLSKIRDKPTGTIKFAKGDCFSLADACCEIPVNDTGDYREAGLEIEKDHQPCYLDLKIHSCSRMKGRPAITGPHFLDQGAETLTIHLWDENEKVACDVSYSIYEDAAGIIRSVQVTNHSDHELILQRIASTVLYRMQGQYELLHLGGNWARERMEQVSELDQGVKIVESRQGISSHQNNPYAALLAEGSSLQQGECFGCNLVYSSSFRVSATVNEWGQTRLQSGIQPDLFAWTLLPGSSFRAPDGVLSYSPDGLNGLAKANDHLISRHLLRQQPRPIVINSWESFLFDFDENSLYELALYAKKAGIECFVIDDGWFGRRNDDRTSLGDWFVNEEKFPSGIGTFAKKIHDLNMLFGMWFEPEMINQESCLYEKHPEWVVRPESGRYSFARNQLVLDFSNPMVVESIFAMIKEMIVMTDMDYIKWDMNRTLSEGWSLWLKEQHLLQKEFQYRYCYGVYSLYEKLVQAFPNLIIEGCASGGARFDLGILYYSPMIWTSDNTDAIERLKIQYGTSLGYPLMSMSNHVSVQTNHQTGRSCSLQTRENTAIFGALGYELNLCELTDAELDDIAKETAFYKQLRPILENGTFERLISIFEGNRNECAWAIHTQDEIYIGYYQLLADLNGNAKETIPLPFLDEKAVYEYKGQKLSGSLLKQTGLYKPVRFTGGNKHLADMHGDFQSALLHLKKVS